MIRHGFPANRYSKLQTIVIFTMQSLCHGSGILLILETIGRKEQLYRADGEYCYIQLSNYRSMSWLLKLTFDTHIINIRCINRFNVNKCPVTVIILVAKDKTLGGREVNCPTDVSINSLRNLKSRGLLGEMIFLLQSERIKKRASKKTNGLGNLTIA